MRILTARELVAMLSPWRVAANDVQFVRHADNEVRAYLGDQAVGSLTWHTRDPERDFQNWRAMNGGRGTPEEHQEWQQRYPLPKHGEIDMIKVLPENQRKGIATSMFNWAKENAEPRLHHSDEMTTQGHSWAKSMGHDPEHWNRRKPIRITEIGP